jgi:hypothetical protein
VRSGGSARFFLSTRSIFAFGHAAIGNTTGLQPDIVYLFLNLNFLSGLHLLFEMLLSTLTPQGVASILWILSGQFCVSEFYLLSVKHWTAGGPF